MTAIPRFRSIVVLVWAAIAMATAPPVPACDPLDLVAMLQRSRSEALRQERELVIFNDSALSGVLERAAKSFNRDLRVRGVVPGGEVRIRREASTSALAVRKIVDLGRMPDLVFVSDWRYAEAFLIPELASSYVQWALDEMVLAFTQASSGGSAVSTDGLWDFLAAPGRSLAMVDPKADPCGWRTDLLFKLARRRFGLIGDRPLDEVLMAKAGANLRPDVSSLVRLLEGGGVDYVFVYRSVAEEHGLRMLRLPPELGLGWGSHVDRHPHYGVTRVVKRLGKRSWPVFAERVTHCAVLMRKAPHPNLARAFLRHLISEEGRAALKGAGLEAYRWKPMVYERLFGDGAGSAGTDRKAAPAEN